MAVPTLLVDANLRDPRIADMFGLSRNAEGLSHALRARNIDEVPITPDVIPGLSILSAGIIPPNPQELLSSGEFLALANNLEKSFGVVIYDTAPAMDFADASVVAARVGAAIIDRAPARNDLRRNRDARGPIPRLAMQIPRNGDECVLKRRNAKACRPA